MKKTAIVFPGQGSQYPGMGLEQYNRYPFVRDFYEQADDLTGVNIENLCFHSDTETLTQTENAQLAIFITSYAAFCIFKEEGLEPSYMAGHSLGEITALTCAGVLDFPDAVRIVQSRGSIMQEAGSHVDGAMAAIKGICLEELNQICSAYSDQACISNYNSTDQLVISGERNAILKITEWVKNRNGKYSMLKVSAPFHSPFMKKAAEKFSEELKKYRFYSPKCPVISNLTGKPYENQDDFVGILSKHLTNPVRWLDIMEYFLKQEIEYALELGPKKIISNLINRYTDQIKAYSYDEVSSRGEIKKIIEVLTGRKTKKEELQNKLKAMFSNYIGKIRELKQGNGENSTTAVTLCLANAVCTPNNNISEADYQKEVIVPYSKIRKLQARIEREGRNPAGEEIEEAFWMLYSVFQVKWVSYEEQELRVRKIYEALMIAD